MKNIAAMISIEPLSRNDAAQVAVLHINGIRTGFISSLGPRFVTALYEAIADQDNSFGFTARDDADRIVGFVVFTNNINALYKKIIWKKGWRLSFLLLRKIFRYSTFKRVWETILYPHKTRKPAMPAAELLAISVDPALRGRNIAYSLIQQGLGECRQRRIDRIKLLVAADNIPANRLYRKCGFELLDVITNHGIKSNIYIYHV